MASKRQLLASSATLLIAEPALAIAHQGGVGAIVGLGLGVAAYIATQDKSQVETAGERISLPAVPQEKKHDISSIVHRMFNGKSMRSEVGETLQTEPLLPQQPVVTQVLPDEMEPLQPQQRNLLPGDEVITPPKKRDGLFLFAEVLETFTPSLEKIYLGTLENGKMVFCRAEELCHVALAGATRGGKSSIMRMLMAQLCASGASVLLLNPHYSRYILDKKEDWTPFEPYLAYDPMECRHYEVIEHYLKSIATEVLPQRLKKYAHSLPVGKPYFLVLDELPAIVDHVPDAPLYLKAILREGGKVGLFLITAAQDFLVSTIFPGGGGAARDCYRTVEYVGGDATTAKVLLDMPARDVPEAKLGKGTVMLRCDSVRPATIAKVPLVDNASLYRLLGPSTYIPNAKPKEEDDLLAYMVGGNSYEEKEEGRRTDPLTYVTQSRRVAHVPEGAKVRKVAREQRLRNAPIVASQERERAIVIPEQKPEPTLDDVLPIWNDVVGNGGKLSRYTLCEELRNRGFECGENKARSLLDEIKAMIAEKQSAGG